MILISTVRRAAGWIQLVAKVLLALLIGVLGGVVLSEQQEVIARQQDDASRAIQQTMRTAARLWNPFQTEDRTTANIRNPDN